MLIELKIICFILIVVRGLTYLNTPNSCGLKGAEIFPPCLCPPLFSVVEEKLDGSKLANKPLLSPKLKPLISIHLKFYFLLKSSRLKYSSRKNKRAD